MVAGVVMYIVAVESVSYGLLFLGALIGIAGLIIVIVSLVIIVDHYI